jgi:hypothetical protein
MDLPRKVVCSVCHKFVSTSNLARHTRIHAYCAVCQAWINRKSHVHNANALRNDDEDLLNRIRVSNGLSYRRRRRRQQNRDRSLPDVSDTAGGAVSANRKNDESGDRAFVSAERLPAPVGDTVQDKFLSMLGSAMGGDVGSTFKLVWCPVIVEIDPRTGDPKPFKYPGTCPSIFSDHAGQSGTIFCFYYCFAVRNF